MGHRAELFRALLLLGLVSLVGAARAGAETYRETWLSPFGAARALALQ